MPRFQPFRPPLPSPGVIPEFGACKQRVRPGRVGCASAASVTSFALAAFWAWGIDTHTKEEYTE
jgi:hypothetical protein